MYGEKWLEETYKYIQEDKKEYYRVMSMLMPLARSPMSKKGAQDMKKYGDNINKMLDRLTPWTSSRAYNRATLKRMGVREGEVVAIIDSNDSKDNPLYKDTKVIRR